MRINIVSESEISVRGHGVHTAYFEMARTLNARSDCQVIVNDFSHRPDVDITHIHTVGFHAWGKLLFGKGKKVVTAHIVPDSLVGSLFLARYWAWAAALYLKFFYGRADKILAVSHTVAWQLAHELRLPKEKIIITHNTIDTTSYKPQKQTKAQVRQQLNYAGSDFIVLGIGQVQPRKRFDSFVHMAKSLPGMKFIWVGGMPFKQLGADYSKMKKLLDNTPPNLHVTGLIEHDEVKQYLHVADVFVLPATQENHPMAVIEAAASGLPIVLRDLPEYDDTFGQNVLRCKNDQAFIDTVKKLQSDNALRQIYTKKAHIIAKTFDSKTGADRLMKIYKELLVAKAASHASEKA